MPYITLSQNKVALIDQEDFERVSKFKWSAQRIQQKNRVVFYAYRTVWNLTTRTQQRVLLHRFILNAPEGQFVDHRNHNPLDCHRSNLRLCTQRENLTNRHDSRTKLFRGVRERKTGYYAQITVNNQKFYLGFFTNALAAAQAYDAAAIEKHGAFAVLNFPNQGILMTEHEAQDT